MVSKMIELYIKLLQQHDWDYEFSSDQFVWRKGNMERQELNRMQKLYDENYQIWNTYCDYDYCVGLEDDYEQ